MLSEIVTGAPVLPTSVGYIYMLVDAPSGEICGRCIERFKTFQTYAPGVSLTAVAMKNQYEDGTVYRYDGSKLFK